MRIFFTLAIADAIQYRTDVLYLFKRRGMKKIGESKRKTYLKDIVLTAKMDGSRV